MRIKYVPLFAEDVDEQVRFFTETLGFKPVEKANLYKNGKTRLVSAPDGDVLIAISDNEAYEGFKSCIIMNTDDCIKTYHQLKTDGVSFSKEPQYMAAGLVAEFTDGYGNRFMLLEERNYDDDL